MDIGSIFSINCVDDNNKEEICQCYEHEIQFSLCREALFFISKMKVPKKVVMLPAYTCQSVIDPFVQEKWSCVFYGINKNFTIDEVSFEDSLKQFHPSLVLIHPFYGKELNNVEKNLLTKVKKQKTIIVEDISQSIFLERDNENIDYYVGSYRKWFPIPDGGFLFSKIHSLPDIEKDLPEYSAFVRPQRDAMYLRGRYFTTNDEEEKMISIRVNKFAENMISNTDLAIHKMSEFSRNILSKTDQGFVQEQRLKNFEYIAENLHSNQVTSIIDRRSELASAPLYYPIYVENRTEFQAILAQKKIYAPILWPVENNAVILNDTVRYIYEHILALPVDQRYGIKDMKRMVDVINSL